MQEKMENDEEFVHNYFLFLSQLCFDKAKEHLEKEKEANRTLLSQSIAWTNLSVQLQQLLLAEKSYMEIGFLQNKNKGFLRKDNSLRTVYETLKLDIRRIEDLCRQGPQDKKVLNYCQNTGQFISARINLIDFYDKIYMASQSKSMEYYDLLKNVENLIQKNALSFTDITLTPIKAVFSIECEILEQLFSALMELQRLQFLPSLAFIHGAHTRLMAWENKIQNRETRKLGFLKNNQLPALILWHSKFKGTILSKFSLFFHDTLASQTTSNDMRQLCSKLHYDFYAKIVAFQKKYNAISVMFLSDNQVSCDTTSYDSFPVIVSYPHLVHMDQNVGPKLLETVLKMISDSATELANTDRSIYKYSSQEKTMFILTTVEPNIYLVLIFESKKTEKDTYITTFVTEMCMNLRCVKIFSSLKTQSK